MTTSTDNTNEQSNIALDLDALAPKAAQIVLGGKALAVPALELPDYAKLLDISSDLTELKDQTDPAKVMPVYNKIRELIDTLIPDIKDQKLNLAQLTAIFNMLVTINSPEDKTVKELAKRGIELKKNGNSDPKDLTSSEPSQSSSEATPATE
jgi:hypothetical protein